MAEKQILIICGEASGDLNAANLVNSVKQIAPEIKFTAVGGSMLARSGCRMIYDIRELSVIGLFDVLKKLPRFFALRKLILAELQSKKFDAIIFVDFSGFNLRLAKAINKSLPTIYYISPQVWASRQGRIESIKKYIDKMIVLFEFEKKFYAKFGMDVEFVGHPLLDIVKPTMDKKSLLDNLKFSKDALTISLLPGSRVQEVERILPVMLESCRLIQNEIISLQCVIAKSTQVDWKIYKAISQKYKLTLKIVEDKTYDCLNISDLCLITSGTATLEAAIMQKAFAVIYKMNTLSYLLYRPQVKVPFISIVNILSAKSIVPEFIQFNARPDKIASWAIKILKNHQEAEKMKQEFSKVKALLGNNGASQRAAHVVVNFLKNNEPKPH